MQHNARLWLLSLSALAVVVMIGVPAYLVKQSFDDGYQLRRIEHEVMFAHMKCIHAEMISQLRQERWPGNHSLPTVGLIISAQKKRREKEAELDTFRREHQFSLWLHSQIADTFGYSK